MMRKLTSALLLVALCVAATAQHKKSDSLLAALQNIKTDIDLFVVLITLSRHYYITFPDSGIICAQKGYEIAQKNNWISAQDFALKRVADSNANISDYAKAKDGRYSVFIITLPLS